MALRRLLALFIPVALFSAANAPVIDQPLSYAGVSYETILFDTKDGDLAQDEYAEVGDGRIFYRAGAKEDTGVLMVKPLVVIGASTSPEVIDLRDGRTKVAVACERCAAYGYFTDDTGKVTRQQITHKEYDDGRKVANAPFPQKSKKVSLLKSLTTKEAEAAIARDATSGANTTSSTSVSVSHTNTGSNLILMGACWHGTDEVESMTYNSVAMTEIARNADTRDSEFSYLINPATGANTLSCSWSSSAAFSGIMGMSYTGAAQTGQPDSSNSASQSTGAATVTISTTVVDTSGAWFVCVYVADGGGAFTPNSPTSLNKSQTSAQETFQGYDSNGTVASGSQTCSVTYDGGGGTLTFRKYIASISDAAAAAAVEKGYFFLTE